MTTRSNYLVCLLLAATAVVVCGCADARAPAQTSSNSAASPRAVPGVAPAPHWPIPGIDAGNTATPSPGPDGVIDHAWAWGSIEWSPNGRMLAAAALSQEGTDGQIHLFDRSGHPVGAVPGWQATWIDDADLMTLETNEDGVTWSAWRWASDATSRALVTQGAIGLLGNAHGGVAIKLAAGGGHESYRIWRDGGLGSILPGSPAAWSPDGREIAILKDVVGAPSGGTGAVRPVSLEVVDAADLHAIAGFPAYAFDPRTVILFDPSGMFLATSEFVFDLDHVIAYKLPQGSEFVAWAEDGSALVASEAKHTIARWDSRSHRLGAPLPAGSKIRTSDGASLTVPALTTRSLSQFVSPGAVSPDRLLRAWYPLANGLGDTPLRLVPTLDGG